MNTLYDLLGVRPDADDETLKRAFRKAVKTTHPDLNAGDPDALLRFRQIVIAHDILRDAKQRAVYDRLMEWERQRLRSKWKRMIISDAIAMTVIIVALVEGYALFVPIPTTAVVAVRADDAVKRNAEGNVDNAGKPVETTGAQVMEPTDAPDQNQPRDKHDGTEVPNGASKLSAEKHEDANVLNEMNKPSDEAGAIMRSVMQRLRDGGDAQATAGRELALGPSAGATPDRDEVAALLARAHAYLSAGDVAAARLVLRRAAQRDDPQAALALGGTYDPTVLKRLGIVNFQADPAMAREWYRRAAQLGSADASLRLGRIEEIVETDLR